MADLTDKEITEACARAMGTEIHEVDGAVWCDFRGVGLRLYNPLQDRAQAMDLVLRLNLTILPPTYRADELWGASEFPYIGIAANADLLRAICLCAARLQIEKEKNRG